MSFTTMPPELRGRLAAHDAAPEDAVPWETVRAARFRKGQRHCSKRPCASSFDGRPSRLPGWAGLV